jgi:hypothetical protein
MEREFIQYTEALELNKLGFDEPCFSWWGSDGVFKQDYDLNNDINAPLFQQAFRFFREKYKIEATTSCFYSKRLDIPYEERQYHCHIIRDGVTSKGPKYKTYEEAELVCLKKLIEIVKEKQL